MEADIKIPTGSCDSPEDIDDPRVLAAVNQYVSSLEAGETGNRSAILSRFPKIAEQLGECLDSLKLIHQIAPRLGGSILDPTTEEHHPATLGDFRIIREVGRGGMGVVFEAEQISVKRRIALKVLPFASVLDARQLQRFRIEAQAAGQLQHQNIVPVYVVGESEGLHFYAMQYVDGMSLAQLIQQIRGAIENPAGVSHDASNSTFDTMAELSTQASNKSRKYYESIARLGMQLARALQHAHERGVVHRDIKPANVMIDNKGTPWITDFGLAQIESEAGVTMTGDVPGTLRYMSPEQAAGQPGSVDQRSDLYSLGATLYELLVLRPAFPATDRAALLRDVMDSNPVPIRRIDDRVPRDLETIILKCMEREPAERYSHGRLLAEDFDCFLSARPIRAIRPKLAQRAMKWIRRNPVPIVVVMLFLVLIIGGLSVGITLVAREAELAFKNEREATLRATEADAVVEFFIKGMLTAGSPMKTKGETPTILEVLDNAQSAVAVSLEGQPLARATVRTMLAQTYHDLGRFDEAERQVSLAVETRQRILGVENAKTHEAMRIRADLLRHLGQLQKAKAILEQTIRLQNQHLDPSNPETLASQIAYVAVLHELGDHDRAMAINDKALDHSKKLLGTGNSQTLIAMHNLAVLLKSEGILDDAIKVARNTLDANIQRHGKLHPRTIESTALLAELLKKTGALDSAVELLRQCYERREKVLGPTHPLTLKSARNLITALQSQETLDEAESFGKKMLERHIEVLGESHGETLLLMNHVAMVCLDKKNYSDAQQLLERLQKGYAATLSGVHPKTLRAKHNYALSLDRQGKNREAQRLYRALLTEREAVIGESHTSTLTTATNLAAVLMRLDRFDESLELARKTLERRRAVLGEEHTDTLTTMATIASVLDEQGMIDDAVQLSRKVWEGRAKVLGVGHENTLSAMRNLAIRAKKQGNVGEAHYVIEEALTIASLHMGRDSQITRLILQTCASFNWHHGELDRSLQLHEESYQLRLEVLGRSHKDTLYSMNQLGRYSNARAWRLATSRQVGDEDLARARRLVTKALEISPGKPNYLNTLGVVEYRSGNWQACIDSLQESAQRTDGGNSTDWLFQAMARWQLGDKDMSRFCFEKAVSLMEVNKENNDEVSQQFIQEAAELLGVVYQ